MDRAMIEGHLPAHRYRFRPGGGRSRGYKKILLRRMGRCRKRRLTHGMTGKIQIAPTTYEHHASFIITGSCLNYGGACGRAFSPRLKISRWHRRYLSVI
jgi:hypothetical protein